MSVVERPPEQDVPSSEDDLRRVAIERLEARRGFWTHLTAYVAVNGVLVALWFVMAGEGLFWPVFPILGWGIGIMFHALGTFRAPLAEDRIRREMQRLGGGGPGH